MNWLLQDNIWYDWDTDTLPSESWDAEAKQYIIDLSDPFVGVEFHIGMWDEIPDDGVIDFEYSVGGYLEMPGQPKTAFIQVVDDFGVILHSEPIESGDTGRVTVDTVGSMYYEIAITYLSDQTSGQKFDTLDLTISPVAEAVIPTGLPWWYCTPKLPAEPCSERPEGFVPFSEYDADFKFPLASSRVPSKVKRPDDCFTCSPTLIEASVTVCEPEPEGPCTTTGVVSPYGYDTIESVMNFPSWFAWELTNAFYVRINGITIYEFEYSNGDDAYLTADGSFSFSSDDAVLSVEVSDSPVGGTWSCLELSTYAAES